jgi:GT2 family glycosyltransferase
MSIDLPLSDAPRVSVIIPSSTRLDLLHACLRSLARFGPTSIPYETIVVLNQATGEAETRLGRTATGIQVISSPVNLGLAGAGNRGRAVARGELLILLHDDAEIEPGWMEALVETADAHPEAGAIGGKVLFPDGRLQWAGGILWRTAAVSRVLYEDPAFDRIRAVDFCGTSSLLVRAALWDLVGGLDEQFYPVYYVDIDLAMAMRKLGFVVLYQPSSRIRHHQGASSNPDFREFLAQRNRLLLVKKWGLALENHELYENNSSPRQIIPYPSRAAVERALARAEFFADRRRRTGNMIAQRSAWPKAFNAAEQHSRHIKKSLELQEAYATYQTRRSRTFAGKVARSLIGTKLYEPARKIFYSLPDSLRRNFPLE